MLRRGPLFFTDEHADETPDVEPAGEVGCAPVAGGTCSLCGEPARHAVTIDGDPFGRACATWPCKRDLLDAAQTAAERTAEDDA